MRAFKVPEPHHLVPIGLRNYVIVVEGKVMEGKRDSWVDQIVPVLHVRIFKAFINFGLILELVSRWAMRGWWWLPFPSLLWAWPRSLPLSLVLPTPQPVQLEALTSLSSQLCLSLVKLVSPWELCPAWAP